MKTLSTLLALMSRLREATERAARPSRRDLEQVPSVGANEKQPGDGSAEALPPEVLR